MLDKLHEESEAAMKVYSIQALVKDALKSENLLVSQLILCGSIRVN